MGLDDGTATVRVHECPRCGYDLRGSVASWGSECPLRGRCSECGLDFAWGDVLMDRLHVPRWSFEQGRRVSPGRWVKTAVRVAGVPGTWGQLRLERPVKAGRLVLFVLLVYAAVHAALAAPLVWRELEWQFAARLSRPSGLVLVCLTRAAWPYVGDNPVFEVGATPVVLVWGALHWASLPLLMLVLDETMRRVRVKRVHVARGAVYSAVPIGLAVMAGIVWIAVERGQPTPQFGPIMAVTAVTGAWWWWFVGSYLRLARAWLIAGVLTGVGVLASFSIGMWVMLAVDVR